MPITYDDAGRVKRPGKRIQFDEAMLANYANCVRDLKYFATNYYYIVHPVTGSQLIQLRDYQHRILDSFMNERFTCLLSARQVGKCLQFGQTVEILNEETGEVLKIPIGEFLKLCEDEK